MPTIYEASISLQDKSKKISATSLHFDSAAAITYATDQTGVIPAWQTAVEALSLSTRVSARGGPIVIPVSPALPTDDNAYNSAKITVFYHDTTTGEKFRYSVPARKAANYNTYPGTKDVILTVAAGGTAQIEALITATQAGRSPNGNNIIVDSIVISGGKQ